MGRETTSTASRLKELAARAESWPKEIQEEAIRLLLEIEADLNASLTAEDIAAIDEGLEDVRQGRVVPEEEVWALFDRYRGK